MRALVIGFGKMGMLHAATLNSLPGITEVIVAEQSKVVAEALHCFNSSIKVYEQSQEALEKESIDFGVIATPTGSHAALLKSVWQKRLPAFVEKPLTTGLEQAKELLAEAARMQKPSVKAVVGYCLQFAPTFQKARALLADNLLGEVEAFNATMHSSDVLRQEKGWRFQKKLGQSGVVMDLGSHLVDMVRSFFGMPASLTASLESRYSKNVEDYFQATFMYARFEGKLEACWSMPDSRRPYLEIKVFGTNGELTVGNDRLDWTLRSAAAGYSAGQHREGLPGLARPAVFDLAGSFYTHQMEAFLESVRSGNAPINGLADSIDNHRLLELIYRSNQKRLSVESP